MDLNPPQTCDAASISQPARLGLGWTKEGSDAPCQHGNASGLHALQLPKVPVNLSEGIESYIPKVSGNLAGVEILIREARAAEASLDECNVLTFRNNLNKIMGTVFDQRTSWTIDGCMQSSLHSPGGDTNTLYLDIVKTDDSATLEAHLSTFMAWGFQFEARCTGAAYADANSEYGMLVTWTLRGTGAGLGGGKERLRVYMGAEIDAFDPEVAPQGSYIDVGVPPLSSLREIKTYTLPTHPGQWVTLYRHKHPKWWLQSYLAGVPALILGARDKKARRIFCLEKVISV